MAQLAPKESFLKEIFLYLWLALLCTK